MSHLTYYNYDGVGQRNRQNFKYSQAVRVDDRIECSGQGKCIPTHHPPSTSSLYLCPYLYPIISYHMSSQVKSSQLN